MSQAEFDQAAADIKNLGKKPSDADLLRLYGLFKQATVGENDTSKPGMLDIKGKAKWDAWNANKGKSREGAQREYIALVRQLQAK